MQGEELAKLGGMRSKSGKARRQWGSTGVFDFQIFRINSTTKQNICDHLHAEFQIEVKRPDAFFAALDMACAMYKSGLDLAKLSSPGKVKSNLNAAIEAAVKLNDKLNNLDGNSYQLLRKIEGGSVDCLKEHFLSIFTALSEASHLAAEYPKGRRYEFHRLYLAVDVADAIRAHLGVEPTTTKEGGV